MSATRFSRETQVLFRGGSEASPRVFFSPGRANLLGAHMDYNGGCVVPVALSKGTYGAFALRNDGVCRFRSAQFSGEEEEVTVASLAPRRHGRWSAYLEGAVWAARRAWGAPEGLEAAVVADLPIAKGLSSSASVTTLAVFAIAELLGRPVSEDELVNLAHQAENEYVGVRCGLLDPAAILIAQPDSALLFDCLHHTREHLPLDSSQVLVGILDSGVRRELADSAFNERVAECTRALAILQERHPGLTALREVDRKEFEAHRDRLPPVLQRRVQHVIDEAERTEAGARSLRHHDLAGFGAAMSAAQDSLRECYEVSTPELDALTDAAREHPACYGSRLTGAGFGGCAVALVHPDGAEDFAAHVAEAYRRATSRGTSVQWFRPSGGPREVFDDER